MYELPHNGDISHIRENEKDAVLLQDQGFAAFQPVEHVHPSLEDWRRFVFEHSGSDPTKDYYFVLRSAQEGGALAFISEFCFMSNPDDQLWLLYTENLEKEATAQFNAIMKYFETHPY